MNEKREKIGVAREGYPIIGLLALSSLIFALIKCWPLAFICLLLTWFAVFFFRDPERVIPTQKGVAVSPADGKIVKITPTKNPFTQEDCTLVSVFMNVFSVHVNRMPVTATIEDITYYEGLFLNAAWDKASTHNERCSYLLRSDAGDTWCVVQIAGLIARRIVSRVTAGEELCRGERFGLIRFGSRVDVYIPTTYTPAVNIGDRVFAGQSILAKPIE